MSVGREGLRRICAGLVVVVVLQEGTTCRQLMAIGLRRQRLGGTLGSERVEDDVQVELEVGQC